MCQPLRVHELPKLSLAAQARQQAFAVGEKILESDEFPNIGVARVAQNFGHQPNLLGLLAGREHLPDLADRVAIVPHEIWDDVVAGEIEQRMFGFGIHDDSLLHGCSIGQPLGPQIWRDQFQYMPSENLLQFFVFTGRPWIPVRLLIEY